MLKWLFRSSIADAVHNFECYNDIRSLFLIEMLSEL